MIDPQTVETAKGYLAHEAAERILVWVVGHGWNMGYARKYQSDGRTVLGAEGFHGDFEITHWTPLPPPPYAPGAMR